MHPLRTTYHLARTPADYRICHALREATDTPRTTLGFPTVYAIRDQAIVGFLATNTSTGQIVAGPLVIDPTLKNPIFVALRLAEAYEQVLTDAGVTSYRLGVTKDRAGWLASVERAGFRRYAETETDIWLERTLTHG